MYCMTRPEWKIASASLQVSASRPDDKRKIMSSKGPGQTISSKRGIPPFTSLYACLKSPGLPWGALL